MASMLEATSSPGAIAGVSSRRLCAVTTAAVLRRCCASYAPKWPPGLPQARQSPGSAWPPSGHFYQVLPTAGDFRKLGLAHSGGRRVRACRVLRSHFCAVTCTDSACRARYRAREGASKVRPASREPALLFMPTTIACSKSARARASQSMSLVSDTWSILTRSQRRQVLAAQGVSLFLAFSTVSGIAAIAPFFAVLGNPGLIDHNALLHWIFIHGGFSGKRSFVV